MRWSRFSCCSFDELCWIDPVRKTNSRYLQYHSGIAYAATMFVIGGHT